MFEQCSMHLVDFGFATKYLESKGNHIKEDILDKFRGNLLFASQSQMEFYTTSRRDDLISLCYILIFMLNEGNLLGIDNRSQLGIMYKFDIILEAKRNQTM